MLNQEFLFIVKCYEFHTELYKKQHRLTDGCSRGEKKGKEEGYIL